MAVPDFVFCAWPEVGINDYDDTCLRMAAAAERPAQLDAVGWIGNGRSHPVRTVLHRLGQERPDLLDVHCVEWIQSASRTQLSAAAGNALTLPEQVRRWGELIDVEGAAYSGRLKLLFHSGRPVLLQDRPWHEWYWDQLVPWENYIPVERDLFDLLDRAQWIRDNAQEAAQIGRAGKAMAARVLTRAAAVDQWAATRRSAAWTPSDVWATPDLRDVLTPVHQRLGLPA